MSARAISVWQSVIVVVVVVDVDHDVLSDADKAVVTRVQEAAE